ncbi:MAG: hypothetical protein OQK04_01570 [Kangiellaceae bacterium]|nr:hypothetical protein [Kangiellaceae bacterium]MCW8997392.1 hypothetical protein [Kangiellaceae bacterium]
MPQLKVDSVSSLSPRHKKSPGYLLVNGAFVLFRYLMDTPKTTVIGMMMVMMQSCECH